jgi:hypothetical protein
MLLFPELGLLSDVWLSAQSGLRTPARRQRTCGD